MFNKFFFFQKSCCLWNNVEKHCWAGQATDGNMIRRSRFGYSINYGKNLYKNLKHLLSLIIAFHCNNGCTNAPKYYVIRTMTVLRPAYMKLLLFLFGWLLQKGWGGKRKRLASSISVEDVYRQGRLHSHELTLQKLFSKHKCFINQGGPYLLTPWSRVLLQNLTGSQLVKKFPAFYGTPKFITFSQVPAICPYHEPVRSSPCPHILLPDYWALGFLHDRQGTLGVDPRAGTSFALGPLSDRTLISGGLVVNGQYQQCIRHKEFTKWYYY